MVNDSRNIKDAHKILQDAWLFASTQWDVLYPKSPKPFITCTTRGEASQKAALASGASKAKFGQSAHNFSPSFAFDIAFKNEKGALDWTPKLFEMFAKIVDSKYKIQIEWGGSWKFYDAPHFEIRGWKSLK